MWINISKSGNSFMAGRARYGGEEASSRCIVRKKTPTTIVLLLLFVNDPPRIGDEGVTEQDEKKTC